MEPLMPEAERGPLGDLGTEIFRKAGELRTALPAAAVREEVASVVREMNSYYSNLIEGHKTLPRDIERALRNEFSGEEEERRNQRLGVAHIQVETAMRERLGAGDVSRVFSSEFLCWIHGRFYHHLPEEEWFTTSTGGERRPLRPGSLRDFQVEVGRHVPPDHASLVGFLDRFEGFYGGTAFSGTDRLVAVAAAHHRLAWIHPFGDGNGRVARLQSQAALIAAGVDSEGLWTLSRGLARSRQTYFRHLQSADQVRTGDFDGRGNLSDRALSEWCRFFLEQVLDQIDFMTSMIAPFSLVDRIESYLRFSRTDLESKLRGHLARLLKALCLEGEIRRGEVAGILGLKGTASRDVIRRGLEEGLIRSSSEKGPIRLALSSRVVEAYFPRLFADLPAGGE
ncbi:MAG: Fic family protein [Verrucomicrobiae bacterium]|nr:Fic family protein [Verrucomicrobiae bacterium]MCB1091507.1 Fic family protein [Verrucomicrobiae bacterium]